MNVAFANQRLKDACLTSILMNIIKRSHLTSSTASFVKALTIYDDVYVKNLYVINVSLTAKILIASIIAICFIQATGPHQLYTT